MIMMNKILFEIEMLDGRVMSGELYPDMAPKTVENFVKLIKDCFYDGLVFHRVIPEFMIQGGGFDGELRHKEPANTIVGEFTSNGFDNPLKHERGVISMARTMMPNSASSQFFIMHADGKFLDGQYAAFGRVVSGMEVVDEIASVKTGPNDRPIIDMRMKKVSLI